MTEGFHRRRHERRKAIMPRFVQTYWVEMLIVLGFGLSIFLFFERLNIRVTLLGWLRAAAGAGAGAIAWLGAVIARGMSGFGLSELIAIPLFIGVLLLLGWRVRWRLQRAASLAELRCPRCGGSIHRVHRHFGDHLLSLVVPVRRYGCTNRTCGWVGLRVFSGARPERSRQSAV